MKTQDSIVDSHTALQNVEVIHDTNNVPYSCTLNFSTVQQNSNKFYVIQALKSSPNYYLHIRYGRVGDKGTSVDKPFTSENLVIKAFYKQYKDKTKNVWGPISEFTPQPGRYTRLDMAEIEVEDGSTSENSETSNDNTTNPKLVLEPEVENVISEISDKKMQTNTLMTFNVDVTKMPLGKISNGQIDFAYEILDEINDIVKSIESGEWDKNAKFLDFPPNHAQNRFIQLSNQFWSNVPYNCGRNKPPPIINTEDMINKLTDLLEIFKNAKIAAKITKKYTNLTDIYTKMCINIQVSKDELERNTIKKLVRGTHAPTHNYGIEILEIFRISKEYSDSDNNFFNNIIDHKLLVHGSRTANFMGILSSGLRLPHPSQVSNGSVLGRGIYFADVVTKSFNYCNVESTNNIGYIILCEVALGDKPDFRESPYCGDLSPHHTSRWALGRTNVDEKSMSILTTDDGFIKNVKVPQGPLINRQICSMFASFLYNEFVIFDTRQYRFKYLVKIKKV